MPASQQPAAGLLARTCSSSSMASTAPACRQPTRSTTRSIARRSPTSSPTRNSRPGRCRSTATRRSGRTSATSSAATTCAAPRTTSKYLDRLGQIPAYFDQQIANMRAGLKRGFSVPREVLKGRDVSIAAVADLKDPTREQLLRAVQAAAGHRSRPTRRRRCRARRCSRIRDEVIPAYAEAADLLPQRVRAAGAHHPGRRGAARRQGVLPPADPRIHHAGPRPGRDPPDRAGPGGEDPCADARRSCRRPASRAASPSSCSFLRTDPQFYAKTPDELLMRTAWVAKQVDGQLAQILRPPAARSASPSSRCRPTSRRTTPPAAAVRTSTWSTPMTCRRGRCTTCRR